jgi:hypothetical protein
MTSEFVTQQDLDPPSRPRAVSVDSTRAPALAFAAVEVVGFIVYVVEAHKLWFFRDDWAFLSARGLNGPDLVRQHGGHLAVLPIVMFRILYTIVGLHSYLPYQVITIALHLVAAALLRAIMRRARVNPWISTVAASAFVLFGAASQNILWAFQIGFTGALVLGLVQLLLADHDGAIDRRDWLGVAAGAAALMTQGDAVTMVGVVGLAMLVKRGWRAAVVQTVPIGLLWVAWWFHYARHVGTSVTDVSILTEWVRIAITGAFDALGQVHYVGWALALMLASGLVLAWRQYDNRERRRVLAVPGAMLVGAFTFVLTTGINRAWAGTRLASTSRYTHITVALLLPILAVAADALVRRWRGFFPVALALFLIGIPGNIATIDDNFLSSRYFANYEQMVRSLPRMSLASRVPREVRPELVDAPWMTVGWLLDSARSGRIPAGRALTPNEEATNRLRLSLQQLDRASVSQCAPLRDPLLRHLELGDSIGVRGTVLVQLIDDETGVVSSPVTMGVTFLAGGGDHALKDVAGTLTIRFKPPSRGLAMTCNSSP